MEDRPVEPHAELVRPYFDLGRIEQRAPVGVRREQFLGAPSHDALGGRGDAQEGARVRIEREDHLVQVGQQRADLLRLRDDPVLVRSALVLEDHRVLGHGEAEVEQGDIHGLREIVVRARVERLLDDVRVAFAGDDHDHRVGARGVRPDAPTQVEAVRLKEHEIQHDEREGGGVEGRPRRLRVRGRDDVVSPRAEDLGEEPPLTLRACRPRGGAPRARAPLPARRTSNPPARPRADTRGERSPSRTRLRPRLRAGTSPPR